MAWDGPATRVKLNSNVLRSYHGHLVEGVTGMLFPRLAVSSFGHQDRFGGVRFDCCGHELDTLYQNLIFPVKDLEKRCFSGLRPNAKPEVILRCIWPQEHRGICHAEPFPINGKLHHFKWSIPLQQVIKETFVLPEGAS